MSAKRVTICVPASSVAFIKNQEKWRNLGDRQRSETRALATRRLVDLWETIRRWNTWTSILVLAPEMNSVRRWTRRSLYTLEKAGLIETRIRSRNFGCEFRVIGRYK